MSPPGAPTDFATRPRGPSESPLSRARGPLGPKRAPRTTEKPPRETIAPTPSGRVSQNKSLLPTGATASFLGTWPYFTILVAKIEAPSPPPPGPPRRAFMFCYKSPVILVVFLKCCCGSRFEHVFSRALGGALGGPRGQTTKN